MIRFENVSKAWGLDHLGMSYAAATGDLDGDGDAEEPGKQEGNDDGRAYDNGRDGCRFHGDGQEHGTGERR